MSESTAIDSDQRGALFDPTRRYRYRLWRAWDVGLRILFVMLNPSLADEQVDDPTIRRCVGFARTWGYAGVEVVNLFALRATQPRELWRVHVGGGDPVGPENDRVIYDAAVAAGKVVVAWGAFFPPLDRGTAVTDQLRAAAGLVYCFGRTQGGQPKHPLYVPRLSMLVEYCRPAAGLPGVRGGGRDA